MTMVPDLIRLFAFIFIRTAICLYLAVWIASNWWAIAVLSSKAPDIYMTAQGIVLVNGDATRKPIELRSIDEQQQLEYWDNSPTVLTHRRVVPGVHQWYAEWSGRISRIGIRYPLPFLLLLGIYGTMKTVYRRRHEPAPKMLDE